MAAFELCVVFTARERYAEAPRALRHLYERAGVPFRLLIVDADTPRARREAIREAVAGREEVEFLEHPEYLLPNQARNLGLSAVREPYVLFLENDCLPRPGCVERLLAEAKASGGVAVPWVWEDGRRHFDMGAGTVIELPDGGLSIAPAAECDGPPARRERLDFFENHVFLMSRAAAESIGPFDGELNTRELVDYSLSARRAGVAAWLVPGAEVDFIPPPPIRWDELAHYRRRWDMSRVASSNERVRERWRIAGMRPSTGFAWRQHLRVSRVTWGAWRLRLELGRVWRELRQRLVGAAP